MYYLYELFQINIFHYITVRAIFAFFISFALTLYLIPKFIKWAKSKMNQPIYDLAPETHKKKSNTPTMGGVVFLTATTISSLITIKFNLYSILFLATLFIFALIGFIDDYSKITEKRNESGLSARNKFIMQWGGAIIISSILYIYNFNTDLYLPFIKEPIFNMGIFAIPFWSFIIVAVSNAVNLTDGLDGLATVPSIFSLISLSLIAYLMGNIIFSNYLFIPYINGVSETTILAISLIGALLGFLWFNSHPAEIFMGDSGSLTIGALIAYLSIITKSEFLLIFIAFLFLLETISVILQVGSFKLRGKRIFKMAPVHHHFELKGWAENKIIIRFWIIALLSNIIAIISLKIR